MNCKQNLLKTNITVHEFAHNRMNSVTIGFGNKL